MTKGVTILDVAKKCGYSKSTVSLVLQDSREVPDTTKRIVLKAMEDLGYRRNRFAGSLRSRKSGVVGMVIPDHENPFYAEIVQHSEKLLRSFGYDLVVTSSNTDMDTEEKAIERLASLQVEGMIVSAVDYKRIESLLAGVQKQGVHCVMAGVGRVSFDSVAIRVKRAGIEAMEYLVGMGHRRIGFIHGAPQYQSLGGLTKVYSDFLNQRGAKYGMELFRRCGSQLEDGYEAALDLLEGKGRPTAVFASNDLMAIGCIRAARDLGLRVPEDLSVLGVDGIQVSRLYCPSVTTIAQPITKYADLLCRMLLQGVGVGVNGTDSGKRPSEKKGVKEKREPIHKLLKAEFVVRESTGPAPKKILCSGKGVE